MVVNKLNWPVARVGNAIHNALILRTVATGPFEVNNALSELQVYGNRLSEGIDRRMRVCLRK